MGKYDILTVKKSNQKLLIFNTELFMWYALTVT